MLAIWLTILAPVVSRTLPASVMHAAMMGMPMDATASSTAMAGMAMPSPAPSADTHAQTPTPQAGAAIADGHGGVAMEGMPAMAMDATMRAHHAPHHSHAMPDGAPMQPAAVPAGHHPAGGEPLDDCGYCSLLAHSPSLLLDFFIAALLLTPHFAPPPVAVARALPYTPTPVPPARGPPMPSHASSLA